MIDQPEILSREVLNNALDAFIGMDHSGLVFEWNNQAEIIFGRKREDVVGKRLADLIIPPRFHFGHDNGIKYFLDSGEGPILNKRIELSALRSDGSEFPVELTVTPVKVKAVFVFFAFLRDITERKAAEAEREELLIQEKEARQMAEKAVAARDEFLLVAAHELRTPLTTLMLQTHLVKKLFNNIPNKIPEEEKVAKQLLSIEIQTKRLSGLINKVLDVSRASEGKLKLEITEFDLSILVRENAILLQEELTREGSHLEVHADHAAMGFWDRTRIEQVITNLLTNAIKYGQGKPISIKVESTKENTIIKVSDQGMGIAKESQSKLFEKFERFVSSDHYAGMGLGLYITRQLVEAHGGTIKLESELGSGSTFIIELSRSLHQA